MCAFKLQIFFSVMMWWLHCVIKPVFLILMHSVQLKQHTGVFCML